MQSRRKPGKARAIAYNAVRSHLLRVSCLSELTHRPQVEPKSGMTLNRVRQIMTDLALTIKVHPSALGVLGEASGKFAVLHLVEIRATAVTNAVAYLDRGEVPAEDYQQIMTLQAGVAHSIPDLVLELHNQQSSIAPLPREHTERFRASLDRG